MSVEVIRVACWRGHEPQQIVTFFRDQGSWASRILETDPHGQVERRWRWRLKCDQCGLDPQIVDSAVRDKVLDYLAGEPPDAGTVRIYDQVIVAPLETLNRLVSRRAADVPDTE